MLLQTSVGLDFDAAIAVRTCRGIFELETQLMMMAPLDYETGLLNRGDSPAIISRSFRTLVDDSTFGASGRWAIHFPWLGWFGSRRSHEWHIFGAWASAAL